VVVQGDDIVAFNDDYTGYASEIIYTPTVKGSHRLVIRAFTTSTPGVCDVYQGVDGAPPVLLESNVPFAGTYVWVRWKLGEWFETGAGRDVVVDVGGDPFTGTITGGGSSDPYLFLIYPESAVGSRPTTRALPAGSMRHRDHRFEWTRAEFRSWADAVAADHGYTVRYLPVGPDDPEVGPPTQLAVFTRVEEPT